VEAPRAPEGLEFTIHVRPGGHRAAVEGSHDGALAVRVTAPATEGRANHAVERLIADTFGVPCYDVKVVSGRTSKRKRVHIVGEPEPLRLRLAALLGHDPV
jgi:hypothetical protein